MNAGFHVTDSTEFTAVIDTVAQTYEDFEVYYTISMWFAEIGLYDMYTYYCLILMNCTEFIRTFEENTFYVNN